MAENTSAAPAGTQGAGGYVAPPQEDKSWIGVVFGLVAIAVAATGPLWHEKVYGERDGATLRQLRSEVATLETRLAAATAVVREGTLVDLVEPDRSGGPASSPGAR